MGWSGTSYRRIHFLPFTRDGRGYAQHTPFYQSLETLIRIRTDSLLFYDFYFGFFVN